jgi:hypothetical protein
MPYPDDYIGIHFGCVQSLLVYLFLSFFLGYESCALLCSNCLYLGPINVFVDIFANIGDAWLVLGKKTPYVSFLT